MPSLFDPDNPMFLRRELRPYGVCWLLFAAGVALFYFRHKNLYGDDAEGRQLYWVMLACWAPFMLLGLTMAGRREQAVLDKNPSARIADKEADKLKFKGLAVLLLGGGLVFIIAEFLEPGSDVMLFLSLGLVLPLIVIGFGIMGYAGFIQSSIRLLSPDAPPEEVEAKIQNVKTLSGFLIGCAPVALIAIGLGIAALLFPSFTEANSSLLAVLVSIPIVGWHIFKQFRKRKKLPMFPAPPDRNK